MKPDDVVVLDTNVLIHLLRGRAAGRYLSRRYRLSALDLTPLICIVTVGECFAFAAYNGWGPAKLDALRKHLSELIVIDISSEAVIDAYARLDGTSRRLGRRMSKNDLWIAAVASVHDAVVLTTDGDFEHLDAGHVRIEHVSGSTLPRDLPSRS